MPMFSSTCGFRLNDEGHLCQQPPGWGTNHPGIGPCADHGGNSKRVRAGIEKQMIKDAAREACTKLGVDILPHVTPEKALQDELNLSYALVQWYTSQTDEDSAAWPIWQELWMNERRHLTQVIKMMLDAGIAERQVRVMETHASELATAIRKILDALELNEDQTRKAPGIVRNVLGSIDAVSRPAELAIPR